MSSSEAQKSPVHHATEDSTTEPTNDTARVVVTPQSMGGEDFGWFAEVLPIALARLGTHGGGPPLDLHRGMFDVDERAISVGVRLLARSALHALDADAGPART